MQTKPILKIFGKVEPPWYSLSLGIEPKVGYRIEEADLEIQCSISIKESIVTVTCELNKWAPELLSWVLQYVYDWVNAEIDLLTFASGKVFHVHLDRAEYPDGSNNYLIGDAPDLAALVTACQASSKADGSITAEIQELLPTVIGNPTLMLALHDLSLAVRYGNNAITCCARAIEGMRKVLWGKEENDKNRSESWKHFRDSLQLSQPYLESITHPSRSTRHGSSGYISSNTRKNVLHRSWTVMNRVLLFCKQGEKNPLPESEYPMLELPVKNEEKIEHEAVLA